MDRRGGGTGVVHLVVGEFVAFVSASTRSRALRTSNDQMTKPTDRNISMSS
jgi:hypothetical protein